MNSTATTRSFVTATYQGDTEWSAQDFFHRALIGMGPRCAAEASVCKTEWMRLKPARTSELQDYPAEWHQGWQRACMDWTRCSLDARREILVLYWPKNLESKDICAADGLGTANPIEPPTGWATTITTSALTFQGDDLFPRSYAYTGYDGQLTSGELDAKSAVRSVLSGPFTFTYPTVYIAHHPITLYDVDPRMDERWRLGRMDDWIYRSTKPAGVVPVHSTDIFSIHPKEETRVHGLQFAQQIANGKLLGNFFALNKSQTLDIRPFNFVDMQDPVPASLFYGARYSDCAGIQTHCATITDGTYQPQIRLKRSFWNSIMGNEDSPCRPANLVDPPVALIPIPGATLQPPKPHHTPASPASAAGRVVMPMPTGASFPEIQIQSSKDSDERRARPSTFSAFRADRDGGLGSQPGSQSDAGGISPSRHLGEQILESGVLGDSSAQNPDKGSNGKVIPAGSNSHVADENPSKPGNTQFGTQQTLNGVSRPIHGTDQNEDSHNQDKSSSGTRKLDNFVGDSVEDQSPTATKSTESRGSKTQALKLSSSLKSSAIEARVLNSPWLVSVSLVPIFLGIGFRAIIV
jgi:hypothetical protein